MKHARWSLVALVSLACLAAGPAAAKEECPQKKALFDGKTLEGWHQIGVGQWGVEDGVIVGRKDASEPKFGHLVTDETFDDFVLRVKFKSLEGNSGLYFRIEEKGGSGVSGFQAEITPSHDVGGLYETNGRAWVVQPKPEAVKEYYKPGEWNEMCVIAKGGDITVKVNGTTSARLEDDPGRRQGRIALQLHGGNDMLVMFKDVTICEL